MNKETALAFRWDRFSFIRILYNCPAFYASTLMSPDTLDAVISQAPEPRV